MFGKLYQLEYSPPLPSNEDENIEIRLSASLGTIKKILKGEPIFIENIKFNDFESKEYVRKLLLKLI